MAEKKENPLKVVTPKFRLSFPDLFEAREIEREDGSSGGAKFGIQMLFDKKTDLSPLKKVVAKAIKEKWGDAAPKGLVLPFKDGNDKELDGYENTIYVGASTKFKPQVIRSKFVDGSPVPITSPDEIYAGCYARAAINAYAWEFKNKQGKIMKRGVSFNLESVQKLSEGEPFVKRPDPADSFDSQDDGSDDADNFESNDSNDFDLD